MLNLQSVYFGQKHKDFDYKDYDLIRKIARLEKKHTRQCVNDCNGEGFVNGQHYFAGNIDDWAKREYGQGVKSAYIDNTEETIFYKEIEKIENRIMWLCGYTTIKPIQQVRKTKFTIEFQHDPRGNTVKLYYEGDFIEL